VALTSQQITETYAAYCGDSCEVLPTLPSESIGMAISSPPFGGLYQYSSSDRDLSNCRSYAEFLDHYEFIVAEEARLLKPGRLSCIHCTDVARDGALIDLPGDIVKLYEKHGFVYHDRKTIWKEPLKVAMRTRALALRHSQIVKDGTLCRSAMADYVIAFRKLGENREPVIHPHGLTRYAGETDPVKRAAMSLAPVPYDLLTGKYANWKDPKTNKWAHWIWQHYASAVWMDIRTDYVLPYRKARESAEEKHVHPLQLDVIERCLQLWSNPGDAVLTPFMGVGSEVYSAVKLGRKGVGIELKASYFRQALQNIEAAGKANDDSQVMLFEGETAEDEELE